jgi:N-acetylglutamate synthase-like GNAT family acetyltransferase
MSPSVREYDAGDLDRCRELWSSLVQRHRDIYDDPMLGGTDPGAEFDAYQTNPQLHRLWVAENAGQLVGLCGLHVQDEESELEPIIVDPRYRNLGIGALLAKRAVSESRRLGVKYVNVRPVARNVEAIRFFHREGFQLLGRFELSIALEGATPFGSSRRTEVHDLTFEF